MASTPPDDPTKARLRQSLEASATTIRVRFERFIERAQSAPVTDEIEAALEAGNQSLAVGIVNEQLNDTMRPAVAEAFIDAGKLAAEEPAADIAAAAAELAGEGGGAGGAGGSGGAAAAGGDFLARIGIVFDPTNQRASDAIRNETDLFLKDLTDTQTEAVRDALSQAYLTGAGPRATAQMIRDSIGLTKYQLGIVDNYEAALRSSSARALNYVLRNQVRDGRVDSATSGGRPLSEKEIRSLVDQYRKNMIRQRAETIARTEGTRVTNMARQESFRQLAAKPGLGHNRARRVWHATEDDRTRDWHADMQGQEVGLEEPFTDGLGNSLMYPGDPDAPAETVINCRCSMTLKFV